MTQLSIVLWIQYQLLPPFLRNSNHHYCSGYSFLQESLAVCHTQIAAATTSAIVVLSCTSRDDDDNDDGDDDDDDDDDYNDNDNNNNNNNNARGIVLGAAILRVIAPRLRNTIVAAITAIAAITVAVTVAVVVAVAVAAAAATATITILLLLLLLLLLLSVAFAYCLAGWLTCWPITQKCGQYRMKKVARASFLSPVPVIVCVETERTQREMRGRRRRRKVQGARNGYSADDDDDDDGSNRRRAAAIGDGQQQQQQQQHSVVVVYGGSDDGRSITPLVAYQQCWLIDGYTASTSTTSTPRLPPAIHARSRDAVGANHLYNFCQVDTTQSLSPSNSPHSNHHKECLIHRCMYVYVYVCVYVRVCVYASAGANAMRCDVSRHHQ
ncbi:hypothetical protein DINM_006795 [Dirofilaria immitis]|nr:hypothetical protein [Dirofilaria immitis]